MDIEKLKTKFIHLLQDVRSSVFSEKDSILKCNELAQMYADALINNEKVEVSDKEIEKEARKHCNIKLDLIIDEEERYYKNFQKYDGFIAGAKLMRDKQ